MRIVHAGIIPEAVVRQCPGYLPAAADLAPGGRPRATVVGFDLLHAPSGKWVVLEDNLRVPSGLAYAVANRRTAAASCGPCTPGPACARRRPSARTCWTRCARRGHRAARGPSRTSRCCPTVGQLGLVRAPAAGRAHGGAGGDPADLSGDAAGVRATTGPGSPEDPWPVDVLYRRLGDDELVAGEPVDAAANELLVAAARAGTLGVANAPGNARRRRQGDLRLRPSDDRFYLDEEPLIGDVGTWVLAHPGQYEGVRDRLASGRQTGRRVRRLGGADRPRSGPGRGRRDGRGGRCGAAPLHRAGRHPVSCHPTLTVDGLRPRHVDLRVFALAGRDGSVVVPDVALSRVALESEGLLVNSSQGGGSKDTWLVD